MYLGGGARKTRPLLNLSHDFFPLFCLHLKHCTTLPGITYLSPHTILFMRSTALRVRTSPRTEAGPTGWRCAPAPCTCPLRPSTGQFDVVLTSPLLWLCERPRPGRLQARGAQIGP